MSVKITPAKALKGMAMSIDAANGVCNCRLPDRLKEKWQATINAMRSIHMEALDENEKQEAIKNVR